MEESASPKRCNPRNLSQKDRDLVRPIIDGLLEQNVIVESRSSWRSNVVVVPKKDGTPQMTINYKEQNSVTQFDAYPFPHVEDLLSKLNSAKYTSSLDFSQCYHQIPLIESDQSKTAFCFEGKLYHFLRCPFGLKNAVSLCMRMMHEIFKDIPNVLIYIDDIVVFGDSEKEHDATFQTVLKRIRQAGMSLNSKKCVFKQTETSFLGYKIKNGTISPDKSRTDPIVNFPLPSCCRSLQRFVGMLTYYSKYIPNFSQSVRPLYDKINDFKEWQPHEIETFNHLKNCLSDAFLVLPSSSDKLCVRTDASDNCIAAILETAEGRPVFFCSRTLNDHERKYDIVEKEALAIYWRILRLRTFLLGRQFVVFCDHKPLQFIFGKGKSSPKVIRWRLQLQEFSFEVEYCPGKSNVVADCLSRISCVDCELSDEIISEKEVMNAQKFDEECKFFVKYYSETWKAKPREISYPLWRSRNELMVKDNVIYTNCNKLFVPHKLRLKVLTIGHGVHHGVNQTICRIRNRFFWPGLRDSVQTFIQSCRTCSLVKPKFVPSSSSPLRNSGFRFCWSSSPLW